MTVIENLHAEATRTVHEMRACWMRLADAWGACIAAHEQVVLGLGSRDQLGIAVATLLTATAALDDAEGRLDSLWT
jgi:hypothetical protein